MTIPLINNIDRPNSRYLVFTSAGDNSNLLYWLKGYRNFDLWEGHSIQVICKWGRKIKNLSFSLKFNQETKK